MSILSAALVLFFVMDPLGNVPLFISALGSVDEKRRSRVLARELAIALVILVTFVLIGQPFLDFLHLEQESIRIAGGIVLFLIALRMIFPPDRGITGEMPDGEPFVFPLAVPLVAGPSTLATLLLLVRAEPDRMLDWLSALGLAWAASAVILAASPFFLRILGRRGLLAMERLMGMLLVMLAVQMMVEALRRVVGS